MLRSFKGASRCPAQGQPSRGAGLLGQMGSRSEHEASPARAGRRRDATAVCHATRSRSAAARGAKRSRLQEGHEAALFPHITGNAAAGAPKGRVQRQVVRCTDNLPDTPVPPLHLLTYCLSLSRQENFQYHKGTQSLFYDQRFKSQMTHNRYKLWIIFLLLLLIFHSSLTALDQQSILFFSLFFFFPSFFFFPCGICYIAYALHQPHLKYKKHLFISVIQQRQQLAASFLS